MQRKRAIVLSILLIDMIFIIFGVLNIISLIEKPKVPAELDSDNVVINSVSDKLKTGMKITGLVFIDHNIEVTKKYELEYIVDRFEIGEEVELIVKSGLGSKNIKLELIPFYDTFFVIVVIIVGSLFIFPGVYLLLRHYDLKVSRVFHWLMFAVGGMIMFSWGGFNVFSKDIHVILRCFFDVSVNFVPSIFIHLSFLIPHEKWRSRKILLTFLYTLSVIASIYLIYMEFLISDIPVNLSYIHHYRFIESTLRDMFLMAGLFFVILNFIHSAVSQKEESDRKKLAWIFIGFSVGPMVYAFLYVLPRQLTGSPYIPESFMLLTIGLAPITLFMSIVKYRFLDIGLVIKRGTVYLIVITILLILYIGIVSIISNYLITYSFLPGIIAAILVAVLFQPLKMKVQTFVDKRFFKINYNFRVAQNNFITELRACFTENEVSSLLKQTIPAIIPVTKYGFIYYYKTDQYMITDNIDFDQLKEISSDIIQKIKGYAGTTPLAIKRSCESDVIAMPIKNDEYGDDIHIALHNNSSDANSIFILLLGEKKSRFPYTREDVELLQLFLVQSSEAIERIRTRKQFLFQKEETEKLQELNKMKSFFVSSVSHELKTPLTSIRMFAELMQLQKGLPVDKVDHYLSVIQGECDRLNRLINNILDFSKIERGIKEYHKENIDLLELLKKVVNTMEYQIKMQKFTFSDHYNEGNYSIYGDPDALSEVFINLLNNSMKYSHKTKDIYIESGIKGNECYVTVADKGIGISKEDQGKIFEAFYRSKDENASRSGGTGIGLSLVHSIVQAHDGRIKLESELNKGSTFTIFLPLKGANNE
jgi:signal transduction histidine kinase